MNPNEFQLGRPHGGCAILWKSTLECLIVPIETVSKRLCCVKMLYPPPALSIFVCCVYMPCDTSHDLSNVREFRDVLNEMSDLALSHNVDHMICCGDFNTDFSRGNSLHTDVLVDYLAQQGLCNPHHMPVYNVDFTFESFVDGSRSTLDHIFVSDNLTASVNSIHSVHSADNMSDHCALICDLSLPRPAAPPAPQRNATRRRPKWSTAPAAALDDYRQRMDVLCAEFETPTALAGCDDAPCSEQDHLRALQGYHDYLVSACTVADYAIPKTGTPHQKRTPGWSEHVKPLHKRALFWHRIWIDCGRPLTGAVADVRRYTRRLYHKAAKQVTELQEDIRFERMAQNFDHAAERHDFWTQVKKIKSSAAQAPNRVDDADNDADISGVFRQKYERLYNSVGFDRQSLHDISVRVDDLMTAHESAECHTITLNDVKTAVSQLKRNKHDGLAGVSTDHIKNAPDSFLCHLAMHAIQWSAFSLFFPG
jgi:hypothetical protein